jgi:hypothetical protein
LTTILTAILISSFSVLIFRAIDSYTVDSYYPRLEDAYWIEPQYRRELPKVGISSLDDLISKTRGKDERDELALRLLIPKEVLVQWVEEARLVQLKGLGVENLRLLERVGIESTFALAREDPESLYQKLEQVTQKKGSPRKAMIRIWVRGAREEVKKSEW